MNFGNLKSLARAYVPTARRSSVSNTNLELLLNEAVRDVAFRTEAIKKREKFNVVAEQEEYNTSLVLTRFAKMTKEGLWWNAGSAASPDWERLYPRTVKYLDRHYPTWRNDDSSDPERYAQFGDLLIIHNKPDTSLSNGFWAHFVQYPEVMSASTHFPFHVDGDQDTELSRCMILSESILLYTESKILKILGEKQEAIAKMNEYKQDVYEKKLLVNDSEDVIQDSRTKMRGPYVGKC